MSIFRTLYFCLIIFSYVPIILFTTAKITTNISPTAGFYINTEMVSTYKHYRWENIKKNFAKEENKKNWRWEWLKKHANDIYKIQQYVNEIPYKYDIDQFGVDEYWQTPYEFTKNFAGDCEDYAIAKYYLLKNIGYKDEDLRILIVHVENAGGHAVLLVREHVTNKWLLLDNRYHNIIYVDDLPERYTPLMGFNETKYYRYFG